MTRLDVSECHCQLTSCRTATVWSVAELMRLAGRTELAEMLGVSRQRARELTERADFPPPIAQLRRGPIWNIPDVEQWAARVGRTLKSTAPR